MFQETQDFPSPWTRHIWRDIPFIENSLLHSRQQTLSLINNDISISLVLLEFLSFCFRFLQISHKLLVREAHLLISIKEPQSRQPPATSF